VPERVEQERPIGGGRDPKIANPRHLPRLLLRTHTHGASDRTSNKRNELPSPHAVLWVETHRIVAVQLVAAERLDRRFETNSM